MYSVLALLVAFNYFAFRTELFRDEYDENHPACPDGIAFSNSSLNWETFDKDNAPKAFVVTPAIGIQFLYSLQPDAETRSTPCEPFELIRDKSPPVLFPSN